ncbi:MULTISPECIES: L,D-transpeptidase family protein [Lonsdalea]|uniref:L,D-transpeptidase n=2 Tax=Lonsdalea TaxID=1082702 RepID=A0ACD1JEK5_9GAMM|nr:MULTISPECIES: L,D-transpeptidase family protein [Lonsdalea]RAT14677.1 L,D-transpeptidase [Lonsdalea quercina]RAT18634.1 L,D-transpeptidase [Lonsdalea populi]RAT24892.1 L,D-transpeptidase [Lonsdalea populi]RAT25046.1 L,D-transpeptidase [Lonsdalea populi]RAT33558.1 L,D-transpeptidase [Lonsdalea populi]
MSLRAILTFVLVAVSVSQAAFAVVYPLPAGNSRLVGQNIHFTIPSDSTQALEHIAAQFQMGLSNMMEANPGIDVYLPKPGSDIIIPQQLILPDTPRQGIVINSAEMRLYYYPKGTNTVVVLPIGIGELGKDTPINWVTSVQRKKERPTWTPTAAMHAEYAARGEKLLPVYPGGPDNPMGLHALYIGRLYAIHGTNANFGIGLRVSHGCVRLRADDIKYLFDHVPVGTRVQFINEPVKATTEPDGSRYLEVHHPLSRTVEEFNTDTPVPLTLTPAVAQILADASVNESTVNQVIHDRLGIPLKVNGPTNEPVSPVAPQNAEPVEPLTVQQAAPEAATPAASEANQEGVRAQSDSAQPETATPEENDATAAPTEPPSQS